MNAVILASAIFATVSAPTAETFEWQIKSTPNSSQTTTANINLNLGGVADVAINNVVKTTVKSVDKEGNVTAETEITKLEVMVNGQAQPTGETPPVVTSKTDKYGRVLEQNPQSPDPDTGGLGALITLIVPKKAMTIGETLTQEVPANAITAAPKTSHSYKGIGFEEVDGKKTFKFNFTIVADGSSASSTGDAWIDVSNGVVIKMKGEMKDVSLSGMGADGTFTVTTKSS